MACILVGPQCGPVVQRTWGWGVGRVQRCCLLYGRGGGKLWRLLFGPVSIVVPRRPSVFISFHTIYTPPSNPTEDEYSQPLPFAGFLFTVIHVDTAPLQYTRKRLRTLVRTNYPCFSGSTLHGAPPAPRETERLPCTNRLIVCTTLQNLARARETRYRAESLRRIQPTHSSLS